VRRAALLALLCSCTESRPSPRPAGLKVPLPESWRARAEGQVLRVSVEGREVMSLQVQPESALPSTEALETAIAQAGGESLGALALPDGVLLRFRVAQGAEGVLGVRHLAGRNLLCASEPQAQQTELKTVARLCTEANWEN
jgi:hypothetical protein